MNTRHWFRLGNCTRAMVIVALSGAAISSPAFAVDPLEDYLISIRLNELLAKGLTGSGVNVGQIEVETPNATHTTLAGAALTIRNPPAVDNHATGVASLIVGQRTAGGGNFQGVAPGAHLWSANAAAPGTTGSATLADLNIAVNWQLTAPVTSVVNHSWGRNWDRSTAAIRESFSRVIDNATVAGQLQVVAAGNEGDEAGTGGNNTGNLSFPGYSFNALTVGSVGPSGTWNRLAASSSVTQTTAGVPSARLKVDVVAPGVNIRQATGTANAAATLAPSSGTSFATPITTGVVALLHEHGAAKAYSTDPRLMRAVIMNSANKSVENRSGTRWDAEFTPNAQGITATRTSNETGAGKLDAMEAFNQYDPGRSLPTIVGAAAGGSGADVKTVGWDVNTVNGIGINNSNDYRTKPLRKGSYLTSTLTWNRTVNTTDPDPANWTYQDLAGFNLAVSRLGNINTLLTQSNFGELAAGGEDNALKGTSQHNLYKLQARDQYYLRSYLRSSSPVNNAGYALAWRGYDAPDDHRAFNGDFSGDRGAYRDNGWYKTAGSITTPTAVREAWMPGTADNWGMRTSIVPGANDFSGFSQEVLAPYDFFRLSFDLTFTNSTDDTWIQVFLGGQNLTAANGGLIRASNQLAETYLRWNLELTPEQIADLTIVNGFVDLQFSFRSTVGNFGYIDNVTYIPTGSTASVIVLAGFVAARRRRA